jgi:hypothetical protein
LAVINTGADGFVAMRDECFTAPHEKAWAPLTSHDQR